jgi:class 3 adenylate cyclase
VIEPSRDRGASSVPPAEAETGLERPGEGDAAGWLPDGPPAHGPPFPEPSEERKVVSILFVDLVGFAARSDRADPEDIRATLRPYYTCVRRELVRWGGTVEKFIGDAVMAAFGAPVAREDDAERAVRAALRVVHAVEELNAAEPGLELALRAAVTTGEAIVARGARTVGGGGVAAGDVVNTAARLQAIAPVGAVVVDEATYRRPGISWTTRRSIRSRSREPANRSACGRPRPPAVDTAPISRRRRPPPSSAATTSWRF